MKGMYRGKIVEVDPEKITVSIYRSDYRILIAIADENNLLDGKNHPSIKQAISHVLRNFAKKKLCEKDGGP